MQVYASALFAWIKLEREPDFSKDEINSVVGCNKIYHFSNLRLLPFLVLQDNFLQRPIILNFPVFQPCHQGFALLKICVELFEGNRLSLTDYRIDLRLLFIENAVEEIDLFCGFEHIENRKEETIIVYCHSIDHSDLVRRKLVSNESRPSDSYPSLGIVDSLDFRHNPLEKRDVFRLVMIIPDGNGKNVKIEEKACVLK